MKNLYLLTTVGVGDFYVVAQHPTEAENALKEELSAKSYGLYDMRKVVNIKILSTEIGTDSSLKDKKLLIV